MNTKKLPSGWFQTTIGELVIDIVGGGTPSRKVPSYFEGDIPWFTVKDMKTLRPNDAEEHITQTAIEQSATNLISANTLSIATRISLGKAIKPKVKYAINQDLKALVLPEQINTDFLLYWIIRNERMISDMGSGTTVKGIRLEVLKNLKIDLPPFAEQTRIVEKLEELLSDLDNGVEELKAAQIKLAQYRQSLLKSAVEGSLTQEWREQRAASGEPLETGAELLKRILKERRERWEAQKLKEFEDKGQKPPKNWRDKYPEPVVPEVEGLPELPEGWVWASLSQIGWLDRGKSKHRPRNAPHLYGGPYPFVQTGDIREADTYIKSAASSYSEAGLAQSRLWYKGTMCITIAANIGETAILAIDACFPDSIVGFLPVLDSMPVEYVEYCFRTVKAKLDLEAPATAQKNINLEVLSKVCIPLPTIDEQKIIVQILREAFQESNDRSENFSLSLKQNEAQRKNILKAAFSGELVPQDPNDEPASVLLERIRAERAERAKQQPKSRPKKKATTMAKIDVISVKNWILSHESSDFYFDDLRESLGSDYELLKEALFDSLAEKQPVIEQVFDVEAQSIRFKRVQA